VAERTPGPLCSTRVGDDWIDQGTACRTASAPPGPVGVMGPLQAAARNFYKARFDRDHVYSLAPEAARKRDIDLQIIGDNYRRSGEISLTSEAYLKELIRLGSGGKQEVSGRAKKIQFFIIRGGGEGFLPARMAKKDAGNVVSPGRVTSGGKRREFVFDYNDVLAVFDPKGKLIGAALLKRPVSITGKWRKVTSTAIYDAWHNKEVAIYRNTTFTVPYLGLVVHEGMKGRGWVDMHKEEATNGCILIIDPNTPPMDTPELDVFEPQLIHDILASIGKTVDQVKGMISLGVIRTVEIK
jgi:hypothetical protein